VYYGPGCTMQCMTTLAHAPALAPTIHTDRRTGTRSRVVMTPVHMQLTCTPLLRASYLHLTPISLLLPSQVAPAGRQVAEQPILTTHTHTHITRTNPQTSKYTLLTENLSKRAHTHTRTRTHTHTLFRNVRGLAAAPELLALQGGILSNSGLTNNGLPSPGALIPLPATATNGHALPLPGVAALPSAAARPGAGAREGAGTGAGAGIGNGVVAETTVAGGGGGGSKASKLDLRLGPGTGGDVGASGLGLTTTGGGAVVAGGVRVVEGRKRLAPQPMGPPSAVAKAGIGAMGPPQARVPARAGAASPGPSGRMPPAPRLTPSQSHGSGAAGHRSPDPPAKRQHQAAQHQAAQPGPTGAGVRGGGGSATPAASRCLMPLAVQSMLCLPLGMQACAHDPSERVSSAGGACNTGEC
jgi:hypothetical protein